MSIYSGSDPKANQVWVENWSEEPEAAPSLGHYKSCRKSLCHQAGLMPAGLGEPALPSPQPRRHHKTLGDSSVPRSGWLAQLPHGMPAGHQTTSTS